METREIVPRRSSTRVVPAPPPSEPVVEAIDVVKRFGDHVVLNRINLTIRRGETVAIMGESGCGKSTLLRCLIGAYLPEEGDVRLFGKSLRQVSPEELAGLRKRFGVLFQSGALYTSLTVGENVALPLREHTDLDPDIIDVLVKMKLELVGLREAEHLMPGECSGGMAKRAGLARAISLDPELLFYDEPTSGLDPIMSSIIDGLIMDLAETMNVTSVVVTHDLRTAFRVADRLAVIREGKLLAVGRPAEIRASKDPYVIKFIHGRTERVTQMFGTRELGPP